MNKTLGILGGGQLGRMSAQAAEKLGIDVIIYTPKENSPASQIAAKTIVAEYNDKKALEAFAAQVDVISYEFENIPVETVQFLTKHKPVYPDEKLLEIAQDRLKEKAFLNEIGIPTARWAAATSPNIIHQTLKEWSAESCILKTTRFGYDGKGQARIQSFSEIEAVWREFDDQPLIMEEIIPFECEISVVTARDQKGHIASFEPGLNEHKDHILHKTTLPAPISKDLKQEAIQMAENLAEKVGLIGVLGLELFVTKDQKLLANEIAPRTHNSGHWTIDASKCSQFEQHVRAVCGLDLVSPQRTHDAIMINLLGNDVLNLEEYESNEKACIHLYGKHDIKPARKMGHVTILKK